MVTAVKRLFSYDRYEWKAYNEKDDDKVNENNETSVVCCNDGSAQSGTGNFVVQRNKEGF